MSSPRKRSADLSVQQPSKRSKLSNEHPNEPQPPQLEPPTPPQQPEQKHVEDLEDIEEEQEEEEPEEPLEPLGQLFVWNQTEAIPITSTEVHNITINGIQVEAQIEEKGLRVSTQQIVSNSCTQHGEAIKNNNLKIEETKIEIKNAGRVVDELNIRLRTEKEDEIVEKLMKERYHYETLLRKTARQLQDLENKLRVTVEYQVKKTTSSTVMPPGQSLVPRFLPKPLCWCPYDLPVSTIRDELEERSVDMPMTQSCSKRTTAHGSGIERYVPNQQGHFVITARDPKGKVRDTGGDKFQLIAPGLEYSIIDNKNGTYDVNYTREIKEEIDETESTFLLSIAICGHPIHNSPFSIQIFKACEGKYFSSWGSEGSGYGQFKLPNSVAVGNDGIIYVPDTGNHRIQMFDSNFKYVRSWGSVGSANGEFNGVNSAAVSHDGKVYVSDFHNHRIQCFNRDGKFLLTWGSRGSEEGQFNGTARVTCAHDGRVYVADFRNHRIQVFEADGTFIHAWGTEGSGNGEFNRPNSVAVSHDNKVYVADLNNHRIQMFDSDGTFIRTWGSRGSGEGQFHFTGGVAVATDGKLYIAGLQNHRIQVFDANGNFLRTFGDRGNGNGQFSQPRGVCVAHDGKVYVADYFNNRIQVFA